MKKKKKPVASVGIETSPISGIAVQRYDLLSVIESHATAWTIAEVAQLFSVSEETIRRLAANRTLPSFRIGAHIRFSPSSLGYWLRQHDQMAAKASKASTQRLAMAEEPSLSKS